MTPPVQAAGTFALAVTWRAKPGEADHLARLLPRLAEASEAEPGCIHFIAHRSTEDDHLFFLYELYVDEAALAAHQETAHFKELVLGDAIPRLEKRERLYLNTLPASGSP